MAMNKLYTEEEVRLIIEGAIAEEREACAKACELYETGLPEFYAQTLARVIRARWIHD